MVELIKGKGYDCLIQCYKSGHVRSFHCNGNYYTFDEKGILCRQVYNTEDRSEKPSLEILTLEEIRKINEWSAIDIKPMFPIPTKPLSRA